MCLSLAACSSNNGGGEEAAPADASAEGEAAETPSYDANAVDLSSLKLANVTEYTYPDSSEIANMDYVTTALATDHEINVNFVDGLIETDSHGAYVGSLAESWESNEDATEWTFHLRDGVQWVTSNGEVYADVVAEDFVTGLRHGAEFQTGTGYVAGAVKGYSDYYANGEVVREEIIDEILEALTKLESIEGKNLLWDSNNSRDGLKNINTYNLFVNSYYT